MVSYIDPNLFGLPLQSIAPWLFGVAGCVIGAGLMLAMRSWRFVFGAIMRNWRIICGILIFGLLLGGIMYVSPTFVSEGEKRNFPAEKASTKVVVLGMDGLDPDILSAMMKEGKLPAFQSLSEQGLFRRLETASPPESPVVWSSFATGMGPGGHGIFDFLTRDPSNYALDLSITTPKADGGYVNRQRGQPFWERLSQKGIPTHILFCPCTFPPEKVPNVHLVSGMGTPDLQGTMGRYTLISSDQRWSEKELNGELVGITLGEKETRFRLVGARVRSGGRTRNITTNGKLIRGQSGKSIILSINGREVPLEEGKWSPWIEVQFRVGLGRKIKGICRFHLISARPELNLYCTPIQFSPHDPVFDISFPATFAKNLADATGLFSTLGMPIDTKAFEEGVLTETAIIEMAESVMDERYRILNYVLDHWKGGLVFCYFGSPDSLQHIFWKDLLKERLAKQGIKSIPENIVRVYQRMDGVLGGIMERLKAQPDVQLVVVSDHGFDDFAKSLHLNRILLDLGYLTLANNQEKGRSLFRDIDWSRTKAYACGFSSIYLNLRGRESQGIVSSSEAQELRKTIKKDLLDYTDAECNVRPFQEILIASEVYSGECLSQSPDLIVGCRPGYRFSWQTALGAVPERPVEDNKNHWRGDHIFAASSVPGVLLMRNATSSPPTNIQSMGKFLMSYFPIRADESR